MATPETKRRGVDFRPVLKPRPADPNLKKSVFDGTEQESESAILEADRSPSLGPFEVGGSWSVCTQSTIAHDSSLKNEAMNGISFPKQNG
jgi:hypothetical protein